MPIRSGAVLAAAVTVAALVLGAATARAAPIASQTHVLTAPRASLETGIFEASYLEPDSALLFNRTVNAGATTVRLLVQWASVAPPGTKKPAGFAAADPADPHYTWTAVDTAVKRAVARRLRPVLDIVGAPLWAQAGRPKNVGDGPYKPSPTALAAFATAAATRYDGDHGLPRVRYWQVWNEPNLNEFLSPLYVGERQYAAIRYRQLVNSFAAAVHGVNAGNVVVAGALAPFTVDTGRGATVGPLAFMRAMLCMSTGDRPRPTCKTKTAFDVWAIQPYTSGNAFHKAYNPDDVSLGDLAKLRRLLVAAAAAGHIVARNPVRMWVTELAWDTSPPDKNATPLALQARWTSEALWQCWRNGIELVTWFMLRDQPFPEQPFQSGLYFLNNQKKRTFTAFRFPFVAYPRDGKTYVWGRTPDSKPHTVAIMRKVGFLGYQKVASVQANRHGLFEATIPYAAASGYLHAQTSTDKSLDFSLKAPADRPVHPFG